MRIPYEHRTTAKRYRMRNIAHQIAFIFFSRIKSEQDKDDNASIRLRKLLMKKNMGKILAGLIAIVVLAVIFLRGDQLEELARTVQHGSPFLLFAAIAAELVRYLTQALAFTWCFRAVDAQMPFKENVKLVFKTFFIDTVVPSLNMSGTSVVIAAARQRGIADGRATGAALLRQLSISIGFLIVMIAGFVVIGFTGQLKAGWLILGITAVALIAIMTGAMALAAAKPDWLLKLVHPIERIVDKVLVHFKRKPIDTWVSNMVDTYAESAKLMIGNKGDIVRELAYSTVGSLFEMLCFGLVGVAFGITNIEALVCGYIVATLFAMFSVVPQGVGVVEGASLVSFTLFGISQASAMAVIMVYRAIVFWLPFLAGAILMQRSKVSNKR